MDQIITQLGLDSPHAPMGLIFVLLMLSCVYSLFTKLGSPPVTSAAFAMAVNAVGRLASGVDRLAWLELRVEDGAYGQSYAQCASRTA
jgi:hypothetical protein